MKQAFNVYTALLITLLFSACHDTEQHLEPTPIHVRALQNNTLIPTNAVLHLEFSEALDATTVTAQSVHLWYEGSDINVSLQTEQSRILITPQALLQPLSHYQIEVSTDVASQSGKHLLQAYYWDFETSNHDDVTPPQILRTLPAPNQSTVSTMTELALQFDEIIDPSTLGSAALSLEHNGVSVSGVFSYRYDTLVFTPDNALQEAQSYTLKLNAPIQDFYANRYEGAQSWSFSPSLSESDNTLAVKKVASLATQYDVLSLAQYGTNIVLGSQGSLHTVQIDGNCAMAQDAVLEINATAYAMAFDASKNRLYTATERGVLQYNQDADTWDSVATDFPVYDLVLNEAGLYLAQTNGGLGHFDTDTQTITSLTEGIVSVIAEGEGQVIAVDNPSHEWILLQEDARHYAIAYNLYDLIDVNATHFNAAGGIGGLLHVEGESVTQHYVPRSRITDMIRFAQGPNNYFVLLDGDRGVAISRNGAAFESLIDTNKGAFDMVAVGACMVVAYTDGTLQSFDLASPYLLSGDIAITSAGGSIALHFNEALDDTNDFAQHVTLFDDTNTSLEISIDHNGSTLWITPTAPLYNHTALTLHAEALYDQYANVMLDPVELFVQTDYTQNTPPVAVNDATVMNEDTTAALNVAQNDYDYDGNDTIDISSLAITVIPSHGSAFVNASGNIVYTPNANYYGSDYLNYHVADTNGTFSNSARVDITVRDVYDPPVNAAPVAVNDSATYYATLLNIDVLGNDYDSDGTLDPTTVTIVAPPSIGYVNIDSVTGEIYYDAGMITAGLNDTFTYTVRDNDGTVSNTATVTVTTP